MQLRLDKKKLIFTSIVLFFIGFFSMLYDNSAFKMLKLKMLLNFFFLNFKINVIKKNSFANFLNLFLARIKLHYSYYVIQNEYSRDYFWLQNTYIALF